MKNKEYWKRRYVSDKAHAINASEIFIQENLKELYIKSAKEIREEMEKFYQKYADKNHISLIEARKMIKSADFSKVDFEELAVHQVEKNKELREKKENLPGDVVARMEREKEEMEKILATYSKKGQISRLDLLTMQLDQKILDLYDKNQINIYEILKDTYQDAYYKGVFNTQQAIGFGKDFAPINERAVEQAILHKYSKSNFSKTIYQHRKNLSQDLRENLVIGMIRGSSLEVLAKKVEKRMEVSYSNAKRLVRTETAYIYEQATKKAYETCEIERYEYLATLDYKTSEMCRDLDGKNFPIKDARPGTNYPPMHPNCRSTTVCWFENDKVTTRVARNRNGKSYTVPSNMTYHEWAAKHEKTDLILTDKEHGALNKYLSFDSYKMNEKLRNGEKLTKTEKSFTRGLTRALDKMPEYKGNLVRDLQFINTEEKEKFLAAHIPNKTIMYKEFLSTSVHENYNEHFDVRIYIENSTKGRDIRAYNSAENEILYKKGSEFKVKNVVEKDEKTYILMEEIENGTR